MLAKVLLVFPEDLCMSHSPVTVLVTFLFETKFQTSKIKGANCVYSTSQFVEVAIHGHLIPRQVAWLEGHHKREQGSQGGRWHQTVSNSKVSRSSNLLTIFLLCPIQATDFLGRVTPIQKDPFHYSHLELCLNQ